MTVEKTNAQEREALAKIREILNMQRSGYALNS